MREMKNLTVRVELARRIYIDTDYCVEAARSLVCLARILDSNIETMCGSEEVCVRPDDDVEWVKAQLLKRCGLNFAHPSTISVSRART